MAATVIEGTVISVHLRSLKQFGRSAYGSYEEPIKAELELETDTGRIFVSTQVGRHVIGLDRPVDAEYLCPTQERAAWPMALDLGSVIIRSNTPEVFPTAFVLASRLVGTIWEGDRVAVRGSLKGQRLTRAAVVGLERDGQSWRAA